ncbi:hypothetical protein K438DRAFT_1978816 [Mycena galopus ATCC 62051]|nr:hypothetical protein K438DRAFT_1978816 [Mycena galopus ATCC 62051]
MDWYFKILRTHEEIKRLNIEIHRVVTWIRDERRFLRRMERNLSVRDGKTEEQIEEDRQMAVQVRLYCEHCGRFDAGHMERFHKLGRMPGFTGSLDCGMAVEEWEVRRRLHKLHAELARTGGEDGINKEELERRDLEERLCELRAEVGEEEMELDNEEGVEEEGGEDDEGHEAREEAVSGLLYQISMLAMDDGIRGDE